MSKFFESEVEGGKPNLKNAVPRPGVMFENQLLRLPVTAMNVKE